MLKNYHLYKAIALLGYFGLIILNLTWFTVISPAVHVPKSYILAVMLVPLLFPLRGLLGGKPYTYAWSSFLTFFYFFIGVDFAYNNDSDKVYGYLLIILSILMFIGCIFYSRFATQQAKIKQAALDNTNPQQ